MPAPDYVASVTDLTKPTRDDAAVVMADEILRIKEYLASQAATPNVTNAANLFLAQQLL